MLMGYRQYAKHRGCTLKAVQKAIAAGRISASDAKKIDSDLADAAWTKNTDQGKAPAAVVEVPAPVPAALPLIDGELVPAPKMRGLEWPEWPDWTPAPTATRTEPIDIRDFAAARARREAAMAELAEIELAEKRGAVIETVEARKTFFAIGKIFGQTRTQIAGVLKTALVGLTDPKEIERRVLKALAAADERVANEIQSRFADVADARVGCSAG